MGALAASFGKADAFSGYRAAFVFVLFISLVMLGSATLLKKRQENYPGRERMPTPLESPRMKMRQRILREATRQFVERGFDGVSIRDLAEACQVTNAALYYHFPDKEHLFLEILEQGLENFTRILRNAREKYPASTQDCLREFILGIFTQVPPESRGVMRLATQEWKNSLPDCAKNSKKSTRRNFYIHLKKFSGKDRHGGKSALCLPTFWSGHSWGFFTHF